MNLGEVRQVKAESFGPPFGIVDHEGLMSSNDLFEPTLRDFHVIFWFKKGRGSYILDFQQYDFKENTMALLAKDQVNYFLPFDKSTVEIQSIVFTPDFIYRNDSDLKHLFQFNMSTHLEGQQIIEVPEDACSTLAMISSQMKDVYKNWIGEAQRNAFYHWLCLYLINCGQLQQDQKETKIDESQKMLLQFNQLLEQRFKKEFKVEYYLNEMNISIKALSKLTKDKYKLSPKAVIDERRLLEIKRLLKGTTEPTKNIAYDLGFDEPTNMVKYFKKHTGMTPTAFRDEVNY